MENLIKASKDLCQAYNIKPKRSRGQNFLISNDVYEQIIKTAQLNKDDIVLEVGPGLGFLTEKLAESVKYVYAVEIDKELFSCLDTEIKKKNLNNISLLNEDILALDIAKVLDKNKDNYQIVANLPYNITSFFLRNFLSLKNKPKSLTLLLQKEVAERITAKPPRMSLLALSVQFYGQAEIFKIVKADDFWPEPAVESAIIKIVLKKEALIKNPDESKKFFHFLKAGFSAKRKMLKNNLAGAYQIEEKKVKTLLEKISFSPSVRAQELSLEEWIKLFGEFKKIML